MTKRLQKQRLTDIERQAITIWELIQRTLRKYDYSIPNIHMRTIKKCTRNFLKNANIPKYNVEKHYDITYLHLIKSHLDNKEDFDSIYLTWLQFQFHQFIHRFCPEHDPNYKDNRQPYYEKMIEVLTQ